MTTPCIRLHVKVSEIDLDVDNCDVEMLSLPESLPKSVVTVQQLLLKLDFGDGVDVYGVTSLSADKTGPQHVQHEAELSGCEVLEIHEPDPWCRPQRPVRRRRETDSEPRHAGTSLRICLDLAVWSAQNTKCRCHRCCCFCCCHRYH